MLPSITNVINLADSHDRAAFAMATHVKQEPRERENTETKEEVRYTDRRTTPRNVSHINCHIIPLGVFAYCGSKKRVMLCLFARLKNCLCCRHSSIIKKLLIKWSFKNSPTRRLNEKKLEQQYMFFLSSFTPW